jgi:uncharacterized membrane protein
MKINIQDKEVNVNTNPNWLSLLGVVFIICKVFGVMPIAAWSWWLVTLPLYVGVVITVGLLAIVLGALGVFWLIVFIATYLTDLKNKNKNKYTRNFK